MADAAAQTEPIATAPPIPKICANCKHWRPRHMTPSFGECGISLGGADRMLVTTDLSKCSRFDLRQ